LAQTPAAASFYAKHINPILDANCVSCHGEGKQSGGLRMDSYDLLMKGGKDGPVIVAGKPEKVCSSSASRFRRPQAVHAGRGQAAAAPEEIAWIKAWIQQGASPTGHCAGRNFDPRGARGIAAPARRRLQRIDAGDPAAWQQARAQS
jgi:hypothetical protein